MARALVSTPRNSPLQVSVDWSEVDKAARTAPSLVYFWLRNYMGAIYGKHRQQFLRTKGVKFGRGSGGRAIRVPEVNKGPQRPPPNYISYQVHPREVRIRGNRSARRGIQQLRGEAFTGSIPLEVHETGRDIQTSRFMAVPIRTRGTPSEFRRRKPKAVLISRKSKKTGAVLLFERQRKRIGGQRQRLRRTKTGKVARSQPKTKVDVLRLRWILTKRVNMRKTLNFYRSWDQQLPLRIRFFKTAATRIQRDLNRGVSS